MPVELRSLEAIHFASAQQFDNDLRRVVTYDERMIDGARAPRVSRRRHLGEHQEPDSPTGVMVLVLAHCRRHTAAGPLPPAALNVTLTV